MLIALSSSDWIALSASVAAFLTLLLGVKIYRAFSRQQLLSKQIEIVYNLIKSLHEDSVLLSFQLIRERSKTGPEITLNIFEIAKIGTNKKSEWNQYDNDTPLIFSFGCNQIFAIKNFLQNPFLPKEIADQLIKFYSVRYYMFDSSEELSQSESKSYVVIHSNHYEPNVFSKSTDEDSSLKYKESDAVALRSWESLKVSADMLQQSIENWLVCNGIKKDSINIRADFINKPQRLK